MSLVQYVKRLRINLACQILMSDEQAPITSICYEVGYSNLSNFNRQFLAEKGMTPSRFRRFQRGMGHFSHSGTIADLDVTVRFRVDTFFLVRPLLEFDQNYSASSVLSSRPNTRTSIRLDEYGSSNSMMSWFCSVRSATSNEFLR